MCYYINPLSVVTEVTFCSRVSEDEYKKQTTDFTQTAIVDLMNAIIDNTRLSLKDKKHRLKQFQKTYPDLYNDRFSDMKWWFVWIVVGDKS